MNTVTGPVAFPEAFFLDGIAGRIFCLYQAAEGTPKGAILYIPPFAEEMNRCRSTVASQVRQLGKLGYACMLLDPYGTGDSEGDLSDATWEIWQDDVARATDWLASRTGAVPILWGLRLGALLAADVANRQPGRFSRLLLWQPVLEGRLFLTQYLRLRVAFLMDRGLPAETTDTMRQELQDGKLLEVAGYSLNGRLAQGLDRTRMADFDALTGIEMDWLELVSEAGKPFAPASSKLMTQWNGQGCVVRSHPFTGPAIWQLHKRDEVPELVEMTTQLFREPS
ncbi:MAG: hydrolase 2, exosortase A system-associated [Paludibacteraceae bacterium]|nr:hydrolase 2, exosortase A system-associated [Paludibacteraceae bacterium]